MKKILYTFLLISPVLFIYSCEEEEETQSGYNCVSNTCSTVFENPQYLNLADCQSVCGENNNGGGLNIGIGDVYQGGIVFYIDENANYALVASMEDIEGGFEWGCYGVFTPGTSVTIGAGYQNSIDIANDFECETENGGLTAVQAALNYESGDYTDWYLPSYQELQEMYNTIGGGGQAGNIGNFENSSGPYYWSSSTINFDNKSFAVLFDTGNVFAYDRHYSFRVRPIRSFNY